MTTLLVTGGAGFIGSNFVLYWMSRHPKDRLINYDLLTYAGNPESAASVAHLPNYRFVKGDVADSRALRKLLAEEPVDAVVHFAAESHVDRSISEPEAFVRTNVLGTQTLLETARQHGVRRFVHVSTDEVYGSLGETGLFTEHTPLAPNSPYAASKAGSDLLARAYFETYGFPVIITRCSNNYGPYQYPEKLIPMVITRALGNREVPVYGDGLNVRDWLHVEDHCAAIERVLEQGVPGQVYNVGGNNERTNIEIVKSILAELGKPESLIRYVADRLGHDRRYAMDASKLRRELGWQPRYSAQEGLKRTVAWYAGRKDWWGPLLETTGRQNPKPQAPEGGGV
ncbi:dTDP-glucose 4,6-dehydratase [Paenibacillus filicis]|uniref:dTDP-glucose 4,6-dehydratase n=1 Tax=Paenibacillus gyeongsangnamensis TaxID=3388067 RepID=A0ABT4Q9Q9_9BACL|nr:dTDP-glucose 4,6-dehydratase [Paenibacillus filicis]MCZ8513609.1 dTDP-glucose 4,6-dehydratase [Paenibacillus filicis]